MCPLELDAAVSYRGGCDLSQGIARDRISKDHKVTLSKSGNGRILFLELIDTLISCCISITAGV